MNYNGQPYLRSEDLLHDGKYLSPSLKIEAVVTGCPLMQRGRKEGSLESRDGYGLKFAGKEKVLGLGKTNEGLIKVIAGDASPDKWVGLTIRLEVRLVQSPGAKGKEPAIRIIPPEGTIMRSGLARQLGTRMEVKENTLQNAGE